MTRRTPRRPKDVCDLCWAEFPLTEDGKNHDLESVRETPPYLEPCKAALMTSRDGEA